MIKTVGLVVGTGRGGMIRVGLVVTVSAVALGVAVAVAAEALTGALTSVGAAPLSHALKIAGIKINRPRHMGRF